MTLRRFGRSDLAEVRSLIHRTIDASYGTVYPPRAVSFFKGYHSADAILERAGTGRVIVVDRDGRLAATGSLVGSEISGVFVLPDAQRQGLGTLVMDDLEAAARAGGEATVRLAVSLPSRPFYERRGYRVSEDRSFDVGEGQRLMYWEAEKRLVP